MRTAADFNRFYAAPDPWRISRATFRDKVLRRAVAKFVAGKSVLELGCGEAHLTRTILDEAESVIGVDLSDVAIERASATNATFKCADFMEISFAGYDVITAIECVYYLEDREAFFAKIAREHRGILILSGPIIGDSPHRAYFTHRGLMETFARHGFSVLSFSNINIHRNYLAKALTRAFPRFLDLMPSRLIYQRIYITRMM